MSEDDTRGKRSPRDGETAEDAFIPEQRGERRPGRELAPTGNKIPGPGRASVQIAAIATTQSGVITRRQLTAAGLKSNAIDRRAADGGLHRMHRGVYLVGHEALAPLAREKAALLACGDGAVISHISAAAVWGMVPYEEAGADIHVTVAGRRLRSRPGLRVHRASQLNPSDLRCKAGVPLTSPAKALLEMATDHSERLESAFIEAHGNRLLKKGELDTFIKRCGRRPGVRALRGLIAAYASGYTRSRAEREMRRLAGNARLPQPKVNVYVHGHLVDFLWSPERLIVEVDSYGFHGHRRAFEHDRRRDAAHVAAGYRVIRVTWLQLTREPLTVVANIAGALAA